MWGMALFGAVPEFPAVSASALGLAGAAAVTVCASAILVVRQRGQRRTAEFDLVRSRTELSDLTARNAEAHARQRLWEQRYLGLAGAHDDIILWRDGSRRLTHMNDAFVATFGVMRESLLGTDYHPPTDTALSGPRRGNVLRPGLSRIRYEQRLHTVRGWRWFAWEDHAIRAADGTLLEIQSTGRDITARKEAREQYRTANAALAALRRHRETVRRALTRDLLPVLLPVTTELSHTKAVAASTLWPLMSRLAAVQDCLTFEGEKVNVTSQPFEPRRLVAGAVRALAADTPEHGCGIASLIAANVPARVSGDAALVRQLIERLAAPALGEGNGICIRVSADGGRLRLIFETPWPRDGAGTGRPSELALEAVRPVIEAMNGELAILNTKGAVSVWVEIPAPAAGETAVEDAARGTAGARPSPRTFAGPA